MELAKVGCLPKDPSPIRIDRFIEKRFNVVPEYHPLPSGVLGYTRFGCNGVEGIVVAEALDADGGVVAERRIRSTLAHEAGHGLMHAHLYAFASTKGLFETEGGKPRILCRDDAAGAPRRGGYDGRWAEFQANQAIGGLLLPRALVEVVVEPYVELAGMLRLPALGKGRSEAEAKVAEIFDVNSIVARIRLDALYPAAQDLL